MYEFLKIQYKLGKVTAEQLKTIVGKVITDVGKVITEEQYEDIVREV